MNQLDLNRKIKEFEDDLKFHQDEFHRLNAEFALETNPSKRFLIKKYKQETEKNILAIKKELNILKNKVKESTNQISRDTAISPPLNSVHKIAQGQDKNQSILFRNTWEWLKNPDHRGALGIIIVVVFGLIAGGWNLFLYFDPTNQTNTNKPEIKKVDTIKKTVPDENSDINYRPKAHEESRRKETERKQAEIEKQNATEKQLFLLREKENYQEEERKRIAEQEKIRVQQQNEDMLNRYIANRSFKNLPNSYEIAVLVIDDDKERENFFNQEIIFFLKNNNFNPTTFLFTNQFIVDGMFEKIFNGNFHDISKLELYSHCDYLIIGKVATSFLENPDMLDMITAKLDLNLHVVSVQTAAVTDLIVVRGKGVGFSKESAKDNAMKSVFEEINQRLISALF